MMSPGNYVTSLCVETVTVVKTLEAVDQDKQGIRGMGLGQFVTAKDAIWTQRETTGCMKKLRPVAAPATRRRAALRLTYPPMEMPVIPRGQYPSPCSQRSSTVDSRIRAPPITNRSDTFFRLDLLRDTRHVNI